MIYFVYLETVLDQFGAIILYHILNGIKQYINNGTMCYEIDGSLNINGSPL